MKSLAVKYRPETFDQVLGQEVICKILQRQLELKEYPNCYLFAGPSGDGKTTIARIMAKAINGGVGYPIEIDGASNNGVDNVRSIIEEANNRSLDGEYKIFIIDECHQITTAGWNAFLKCIEEPPQYTIFMFCTTDPQKIPATILNRVMKFQLTRVSAELILNRLNDIAQSEGYVIKDDEALKYIAYSSGGSVRESITNLERVAFYDPLNISIDNVVKVLGEYEVDTFFNLTNAITDKQLNIILNIIEKLYIDGKSLTTFIDKYLDFILNLLKYCIFKDMNVTSLPDSLEDRVQYATGIYPTQEENANYFSALANEVLKLKNAVRGDSNIKFTIETAFVHLGVSNDWTGITTQ